MLEPAIYVRVSEKDDGYYSRAMYARAHLRNKRGYVYLCWREGERVRNYYLGKAPRKSPTPGAALPSDPPGGSVRRRRQLALQP